MGVFFLVNTLLLYTSIFFLISVMDNLGQQNTIQYVEGSSSMESEKKRLKKIMALFVTTYFFRAIIYLVAGLQLVEFQRFSSEYPGFFELIQSLYYVIIDVLPLILLFRMHEQVYGANAEGQVNGVQMQVDPQQQRMINQQREIDRHVDTVILNIIEATESSQQASSRSGSRGANSSFNIERNFSCSANSIQGQLYQERFGNGGYGTTHRDSELNANFSEVNSN